MIRVCLFLLLLTGCVAEDVQEATKTYTVAEDVERLESLYLMDSIFFDNFISEYGTNGEFILFLD